MNHLDVGFDGIDPIMGFAANVIEKYFNIYFPKAVKVAMTLHARNGTERFDFFQICFFSFDNKLKNEK
jgi:hypothetical protein